MHFEPIVSADRSDLLHSKRTLTYSDILPDTSLRIPKDFHTIELTSMYPDTFSLTFTYTRTYHTHPGPAYTPEHFHTSRCTTLTATHTEVP